MQVCKCVKMTKKNEENLLSHICIPGGIFFKFGRGLQCMEANSTINSGKTSWSYRCMKIMTLLFVSIYSLHLRVPHFVGPHNTLPCVLMTA